MSDNFLKEEDAPSLIQNAEIVKKESEAVNDELFQTNKNKAILDSNKVSPKSVRSMRLPNSQHKKHANSDDELEFKSGLKNFVTQSRKRKVGMFLLNF